jgi:predicted RNA-binding protein (virulence factor B family)
MAEIGRVCELEIIKKVDFGVYLDGENLGEILLPKKFLENDSEIGTFIKVFIHLDSDDRIIATTKMPYALIDEFAFLMVADVSRVGAFLDWGLEKYHDDKSNRIAASSKIDKFIISPSEDLSENQPVNLLISYQTELGFKAIIDNKYQGMLFKNDIFKPIKTGQLIKGYIKKIRSDGKIDLSIHPSGYGKIDALSHKILKVLKDNDGYISVTDRSKPELIYHIFGMSKKSYKASVGALYKSRLITIEKTGIKLINK